MATIAAETEEDGHGARGGRGLRLSPSAISYLQATPLFVILGFFFLLPIAMISVVSFWDYDFAGLYPDFLTMNYTDTLGSWVTWKTYLNTLKFTAIVWSLTLVIGFWVAYFLAFHIRRTSTQMILFLVCTVPFMTSNIIRMISWIPVLGRNGLVNSALIKMGIIPQPIEWLLYSDFAVVLAMVHLYTLFMVTPIFNTLMRIDRSLFEAARDAGASGWQVLWNVVIPLAKPGMAIGTIFVVTLVMADFSTVQVMSGGQSASVALMMKNQMSLLQYPAAAANAVVLLAVVLLMVAAILRVVDIRKEL
ncbi:putative spermidine/putrescine transport system permease protein [Rhizobium leguminosarum]|uniref:Spermidine/putrescine transport system permease protein n=2 Tax=Rhizobium TaxID=379 RepID=A0AAE2MLA4_RHILE|nr:MULTISPECIES: ABC transporter permease [Rhizobium]MBB4291292.1 putative spermidine/putrescine transport system permease protein [Rhizobium leguminosarum]MBB4297613.1 putative spermidine/putrescine transport system permease protein [Rhizobium leguminosarum]MBB4308753.1 putative spermidine/putrescine transport system permease protein [Rhizobium leguminosarum]MBB4416588.1 putative spermidine/putrescine transport system permease protein [Rhizobium leguminosarum]MBB4430444.1 putative spermidine/